MLIYGVQNSGNTLWDVAGHVAETPLDALLGFILDEAQDDHEAFKMAMAIPTVAIMEDADPVLRELLESVA